MKIRLLNTIAFLLLLSFIFTSCEVEARYYQRHGYHSHRYYHHHHEGGRVEMDIHN